MNTSIQMFFIYPLFIAEQNRFGVEFIRLKQKNVFMLFDIVFKLLDSKVNIGKTLDPCGDIAFQ
jgi:hypothetical protein